MEFRYIINHLLEYKDLYALLASVIAAVAAIGYVTIAFKLVKTNIQCRVQPNIIADMEIKGEWFYLLATNTGAGIAKNITVSIDPPIVLGNQQIKRFSVESLTPEQQFYERFQMASDEEYPGMVQSNRVITVDYKDQFNNSFAFERIFDNRLFDNESAIFTSPYHRIEERLEKIEKAINSLTEYSK